ncbi:unnamed protein product [Rhizophagus irregularis]|nr:unnamed protein product [Rhizophagus irregularis]
MVWWASEERKPKVSFGWASEERKPKVSFGWLPRNENPKFRSGGLPKNENPKFRSVDFRRREPRFDRVSGSSKKKEPRFVWMGTLAVSA